MQKYLDIYNATNRQLKALGYASATVAWDSYTEAPKGCFDFRSKQMSVISEMMYKLSTDKEYIEAINALYQSRDKLDPVLAHEIANKKKEADKITKVPMDEFVKFSELMGKSQQIYFEAKQKSDYSLFEPIMQQIIDYTRKYVKWLETDELKGYDILLDEYEKGFTTKDFDEFFNLLKEKLVPFVKKVTEKKHKEDFSWLNGNYPVEKQKIYGEYLQNVLCYDRNKGLIKESEHPFTLGTDSSNVRITTHYYENLVLSAIFSTIHELGHATYEMQVDPALDNTMSGGGASMGMHESQSRLYENIVGRSYEFWQAHYPKLKSLFPEQLGNVSLDEFYKGVNLVSASLIRTEADELTYPLHIMVRYEIEKRIMSGELDAKDLPKEWNKMYKEYLGIDVPDDKRGVLQDMHWSGGSIGYFPTYALGSAYAAQIFNAMSKEIDVKKALGDKDLSAINEWLKEKIHKFGSSKSPKEILKNATNEDFNAEYYVNYLIEKYSKIYNV
jgi:carboxypeptidase Taq